MLIYGLDGRRPAKVDTDAIAHDWLSIEQSTYSDGVVDGVERYNDPAQGFERGPGVERSGLIDQVSDGEEVGWVENGRVMEILKHVLANAYTGKVQTYGDEQRVGGW